MDVKRNIVLAKYTTFKIGGKSKYFFIAKNGKEIMAAIKWAKEKNLPFFILGGGSNLLVSDKGYKGLVIKMQNEKIKMQNDRSKLKIICEAGTALSELVNFSVEKSLSALEWAAGIPGTVGGAIRGNAGAFGSSMQDTIESVEALDAPKLKFRIYNLKDCQFAYRNSVFKKNKNLIIFSATLKLKKENREKIKEKIKEHSKYRKERHPKEPSAGSVFKNPEGFFARNLLLECGLAGKIIGGAKFFEQHPNFILNFKNAKAKDVKKLIDLAKKSVKNKFKINLEEEIEIL